MERLIFLVFIVVVALALLVIIEVKYPHAPLMKAIGRAIALLAGIAAIIDILPFDFSEWLNIDEPYATVIPAIMPDHKPTLPPATPRESFQPSQPATVSPFLYSATRAPLYQNSLSSAYGAPEWGVADDDDGASGFDGQGYFVRAKEGGRSHVVWNTSIEFDDFVLEVDATPLSAGEIAALLVAVGWRDDDRGFLFIAAPNGECGLAARRDDHIEMLHKATACPTLRVNRSSRVRVAVSDGRLLAHVAGQPAIDHPLDGYEGGFIGLGVLSYAPDDSATQAAVRFRDLAIWPEP